MLRIYVDANIFIYAMETDGERGVFARRWLRQVDSGQVEAVTSELTLAEVLPHPLAVGDEVLANAYRRLLTPRATFVVAALDRTTILRAAEVRAALKLALPDALHVATAVEAGCTAFLTEDARMRTPDHLRKVVLAEIATS